jgi:hypothetical protein
MESFREWHICVVVTRFTAHLAGYGKMMMGHVGIPKCASAYILRFFFCVTTEFAWSSLFTRQTGD